MKKPKPGFDVDALAAHVIAYEVAMSCLLEALAKQQPVLAQSVATAMQQSVASHAMTKYPGLSDKVEMYVALINTQLSKNPQ